MSLQCYAQRLLNPYRGTMHTIRYEAAEAVTLDGVHWDIYVANDSLLEGIESNHFTQITDIRFGAWSAERGLRRGPIYPSDDFLRMEAMGAVVYQHLLKVHREVPFPFCDHYEFWLLNEAGEPLALLHSVVEAREMDMEIALEWRPGFLARERFVSEAAPVGENAAEHLARCINGQAGTRPAGQWFRREEDGSGTGLTHTENTPGMRGRRLPPEAFPPLLLNLEGMAPGERRLAMDFHAWQAPWLLALPGLEPAVRAELEAHARKQALWVEKLFRLYPETVDRKLINAALVEAMLCKSELEPTAREMPLSTFYIELSQTPDWERGR
jgi:hypothetical protein